MKSLGDTLKSARDERGISLDQVVHETNISRNYLEALEREDFSEFPAEAYLVGFLRNYAEFLGLDADKAVGQFKNYKLSEEPTPMEDLIGPPKGAVIRRILPWVVLALVLAAALVWGGPRLASAFAQVRERRAANAAAGREAVQARELRPTAPLWEGEVLPGDTIILQGSAGEVELRVSGGDGKLDLDGGGAGEWSMLLGEEIYVPDKSGRPRWRTYLKDIGLPSGGAVVEIQQLSEAADAADSEEQAVEIEPPSGASERRRTAAVLASAVQPRPFTLEVAFRDFCLFRYKVDGQAESESYYADGDDFRLEARRIITIWASNAGAIYARIGGEDVQLGRRGEVAVRQIRWMPDQEGGEYKLTLLPLY